MFSTLRKTIHFLRSKGNTTAQVYDEMLGENGLAQDKKTHIPSINMGYWKDIPYIDAEKIHVANQALFRLVSEAAMFSEHDEIVLDVGCGFATNMKYCLENHEINKMIGLNISSFQLAWGNHFLKEHGLESKGEVILASATDMPFSDNSIDRIISIEAAFHFETRETFLQEVKRVLKPGGILSMADLIICTPHTWWDRILVKSIRKTLYVPAQNVYNFEEYAKIMQECGLEVLHLAQIGKDVSVPFRKWFWKRPLSQILDYNLIWAITGIGFMFSKKDYIQVVARKK